MNKTAAIIAFATTLVVFTLLRAQIVVTEQHAPAQPRVMRVAIPASIGDGLLAAARANMSQADRDALPSTNDYTLTEVFLQRGGDTWVGSLTYAPK